MTRPCLVPNALRTGDLVDLVAPSAPFERLAFFRGAGWLNQHFRVRFSRACFARDGVTAGVAELRSKELNRALSCPTSSAVIAARGGVGATDLLARLDLRRFEQNPKWVIGYSDITAIHLTLQRFGICSLHAHNVTGLGPGDATDRASWLSALFTPRSTRFPVSPVVGGRCTGALVGGNLAVLVATLPSLGVRWLDGCILFLEEVGEAPYRIHRLLTQLESLGAVDWISGIVLGHLTHCVHPQQALSEFEKLARRARIPLYVGLPVGHSRPNRPLILGAHAELDETGLELRVNKS